MTETTEELQQALHSPNEYCKLWALGINVSKTKIVIFSTGKVKRFPKFYIEHEAIEVVEDFAYLGVTFMYNGGFKRAIDIQINQVRRAMFLVSEKVSI